MPDYKYLSNGASDVYTGASVYIENDDSGNGQQRRIDGGIL